MPSISPSAFSEVIFPFSYKENPPPVKRVISLTPSDLLKTI